MLQKAAPYFARARALLFAFDVNYECNDCAKHNYKSKKLTICNHWHQLLSKTRQLTYRPIGSPGKPILLSMLISFVPWEILSKCKIGIVCHKTFKYTSGKSIIFHIKTLKEVERNYEEKGDQNETKIFSESHVETAVSSADVGAICDMAGHLQVHSTVRMDHGIPGGKAWNLCTSHLV